MIKFETINGTLCRMVEPEPLTPEAQFPCVVRLIQDETMLGKANIRACHPETLASKRICSELTDDGLFMDGNYTYRYEIIGYPVADGSLEWAWYQMCVLDVPVIGPNGVKPNNRFTLKQWCNQYCPLSMKTGWQLYEPDHDFNVGDWVEFRDIEGIKHGIIEGRREEYSVLCNGVSQSVGDKFITRKLDPSEVVVHIGCLKGTVEKAQDYAYFLLWHSKTDCDYSMIKWSAIDTPTREMVESLLKAQEEEK